MTMDREELKPCPFCGGQAEMIIGGPGNCFVQCPRCHATSDDGSKQFAVSKWNDRPALAVDEAMVERACAKWAEWSHHGADINRKVAMRAAIQAALAGEAKPDHAYMAADADPEFKADAEPVTRWVPCTLNGEAVMQTTDTHEGWYSYVKFTDHQAQVDALQAKVDQFELANQQMLLQISTLTRQLGVAQGKLEASQWPGVEDGWKSRAENAEALIRKQADALRPFAKAGELFMDEAGVYDTLIYASGAGKEFNLVGNHLRAAREALGDE